MTKTPFGLLQIISFQSFTEILIPGKESPQTHGVRTSTQKQSKKLHCYVAAWWGEEENLVCLRVLINFWRKLDIMTHKEERGQKLQIQ